MLVVLLGDRKSKYLLDIHLQWLGPVAYQNLILLEVRLPTCAACFDFFLLSFRNCFGLGIMMKEEGKKKGNEFVYSN